MANETDPLVPLSGALAQTGAIIGRLDPEQGSLPTPCRSWDVQTLVSHVVDDLSKFTTTATGGQPDWTAPAPSIDGDWRDAFDRGARGLQDAWRAAGDLSQTVSGAMGELPKSFLVSQQVAEFAVHSWDLLKATGLAIDLDPTIATASLAWGRTALQPHFRGDEADGHRFGPEVAVADDAPGYDRLAAFFGRDPSWTPPAAAAS